MRVDVMFRAWPKPGCVWTFGESETSIPNASVWRKPWGAYLRTKHFRVALGPRFKRRLEFFR